MIGFFPSIEAFYCAPTEMDNIHFMENVVSCGSSDLINGKWKIIGNLPVTDFEIQLTTRLVANHIYIADNLVR
ncbi:hypothetical protein HYE60_06285 [Aggregatibacter actinomycetemcomitans]|nr:hypothetical protein [Aggregatibacter actinomycetemcomitans]